MSSINKDINVNKLHEQSMIIELKAPKSILHISVLANFQ